jgi:cellulose synthase (UDP-forming)
LNFIFGGKMTSVSVVNNSSTFSGNSRSSLKKRTLLFRYLAEINLILGAWYLQWRITNSINFDALWLSIPLLLAEIYSYVGGVMFRAQKFTFRNSN